jgi:hypothetical protein
MDPMAVLAMEEHVYVCKHLQPDARRYPPEQTAPSFPTLIKLIYMYAS